MKLINFKNIEKKWQNRWEEGKTFKARDKSSRKKCYVLEMYPYPSGSGLHVGHAFNYVIADIQARLKFMQGFNVLHPIGFDSFGLPAENAAIREKSHPKKFTEKAVKNYIGQMKGLGLSYDWSRMIMSHDPEYYKWDQWIFLKMLEKGLAYRKKAPVNFCPDCNTVLANEQVMDGKCWRHEDTEVEVKHLEQWFFKTTKYAEELLLGLDKLKDWPENVKRLQRNWIGKSEGLEIDFEVDGSVWKAFTTRPDTLFGVTFLVVSAQHPDLMSLVSEDKRKDVERFLKKINSTKEEDMEKMNKDGVFSGSYARHPLSGEKIPIWIGNFVLADYGSGMVMAVPAHDQRDFEFARRYKLSLRKVINPLSEVKAKINKKNNKGANENSLMQLYSGYGELINSSSFNGLKSEEAKEHIYNALKIKNSGRKKVQYKLRDWLISRQRFWGTPIPVIYCDSCGVVPVPKKDLPVKLPENVRFDSVENPLKKCDSFVNVKCPKCSGRARRETDTMDTFVNSSWYFLRFCDPKNKKKIFDRKKVEDWMPIDLYIGGKEHATLHLIYFRFYTKFLRDLGLLSFGEPALRLFNQGILHAEDGRKMSKSYDNVIVPENVSVKYGIDSLRFFLVSVAGPDKDFNWSEEGIQGALRFLMRVVNFAENFKSQKISRLQESKLHRVIKDYSEDLEGFSYNLGTIKLRSLFDYLEKGCDRKSIEVFLKLLSPICPHISEELWSKMGNRKLISSENWPSYEEEKINDKIEEQEKAVEKVVSDVKNILRIIQDKEGKDRKKRKVYLYALPREKEDYDSAVLSEKTDMEVVVYSVSDKKKHDPEGKSRKARPGKPGIYVG